MKPALAVALISLLSLPAHAKDPLPGTRFDIMPVGCRIHGSYSTGDKVIDEYIGIKSGKYIIRTTEGPKGRKLIRTTQFDSNGFMVRKDWANGAWETFSPFSCFSRPGSCTYVYRNGDGAESTFRGKTVTRGSKIVSSGGFAGDAPFPPTTVVPGQFNNGEAYTDGTVSFRVTKYENCGETLPAS
jgi:hypothetical protein